MLQLPPPRAEPAPWEGIITMLDSTTVVACFLTFGLGFGVGTQTRVPKNALINVTSRPILVNASATMRWVGTHRTVTEGSISQVCRSMAITILSLLS